MSLSSWGDAETRIEHQQAAARRADWIGAGVVYSVMLHALAVLLIVLVLPSLLQAPPEAVEVIPIDLVQLGDKTASPPAPEKAEVPQEKAAETAAQEPTNPVPVPETPPPAPEPVPPKPHDAPKSDPLGAITPQRKPDLPRVKEEPKPHPAAAAKPPQPTPPVEDLQATLRSLAQRQQQQAQLPPNPRQQDDTGSSNVTASNNSALGRQATYSVKDFIRAQIERHWIFDPSALGSGDVLVSIHVVLNRDGTVSRAEIVDEPRHANDADYLALARSARNAAYLSSPLNLPPGRYDEVRDIVLTFNPRNAMR
jgi:outer membrane biosynthesis protein TonB